MMNADNRMNIGANKLANARRDIVKNKLLTEAELESIKSEVRINQKLSDKAENESIASIEHIAREDDMVTRNNAGSDNCLPNSQQNEEEREVLDMRKQILETWEEIKFVEKGSRVKLPNINRTARLKN